MTSSSSLSHPLTVSVTTTASGGGGGGRGGGTTGLNMVQDGCKGEEGGSGERKEEGEGRGEVEEKRGEGEGSEVEEVEEGGKGDVGAEGEGSTETKEGTEKPSDVVPVSGEGGPIQTSEHIAAVEDISGGTLPLTTSDPVTSPPPPTIQPPTPSDIHPSTGGEVGEEKLGGATGFWAESSTRKEVSGLATLGLAVTTGSEGRSSEDTTPEDSFRSALSTPDPSLNLRQPTNGQSDSQSPIPESHTAKSGSHSPVPDSAQQTQPPSSQDPATHNNSVSQLQPSSSSSSTSQRFNGSNSSRKPEQDDSETKWYITFEQFISCVQTEPDLCQFFAEQNTIDLRSSSVDPILSPYTRTVLGLT